MNQQFISLRKILTNLYPTQGDARRIVIDAELNPAYINFQGSVVNIWHEILRDAKNRNAVDRIINVAMSEFPDNPNLFQFYHAYFKERDPVDGERLVRVLFLASNPLSTERIRFDKEFRAIDRSLRQAQLRDRFKIIPQLAVSTADVQEHLLRHEPDIIHFCGHGHSSGPIILEGPGGDPQPIPIDAISTLIATFKDDVKLVMLNCCYSYELASAVTQHIDCAIGMSGPISDEAAISFATSFYQALGYGKSVKKAFDLGINQIAIEGVLERDTPQLLSLSAKSEDIILVADGNR